MEEREIRVWSLALMETAEAVCLTAIDGAGDPDYTILRLVPTFARGWTGEGPFEFTPGTRK